MFGFKDTSVTSLKRWLEREILPKCHAKCHFLSDSIRGGFLSQFRLLAGNVENCKLEAKSEMSMPWFGVFESKSSLSRKQINLIDFAL